MAPSLRRQFIKRQGSNMRRITQFLQAVVRFGLLGTRHENIHNNYSTPRLANPDHLSQDCLGIKQVMERVPLGNDYLVLLQFFLNHRCFPRSERSERAGKSPAELLTGVKHPHGLEMLGYQRFVRS